MDVLCPRHKTKLHIEHTKLDMMGITYPAVIGKCKKCRDTYVNRGLSMSNRRFNFSGTTYEVLDELASAYPGFENSWSIDWQRRYKTVMKEADLVRYICPRYYRGCFQIRNEWLVNHSARVIAVFSGQPSGTRNTIDYAHRQGVPVILIEG